MNERSQRGMVSLALSVLMLVVGSMAQRIFPEETRFVGWLFLFGASVFLADAAVTLTRVPSRDAEDEARRDAAATPWVAAYQLAFVLTLFAAARTGSSFVTITAMILSLVAATVFLVRRRFFGNLRDLFNAPDPGAKLRAALKARDHRTLAEVIEERIAVDKDPSRRNALLLSLGAVHVVRGAYDEAIRAFERIDRTTRSERLESGEWLEMGFVADLNLASAYIAKGDFESAESCLARVSAEKVPSEFRTAYDVNRSSILIGKKTWEEAIRFVDGMALESIDPSTRLPFLRDLAEALATSGSDPARALRVAEECLAIDEGPQAHNVMGFVLVMQRRFEAALGSLERALERNPEGRQNLRVFAETLYYLGLAKNGLGAFEDAASFFRRAADVVGGGRFSAAARDAARALAGPGPSGPPPEGAAS
jgi:tetratricopeptide (TPR) repeat protein